MASVPQVTIPRIALKSRILWSQVRKKWSQATGRVLDMPEPTKVAGIPFTSMRTKFNWFWEDFDWEI